MDEKPPLSRKSSAFKGAGDRRRSSMGEYVPPDGEGPLSAQCYPTPGPADYDLQGVAGVGQEARKPSIHTLLNPLKSQLKPSPNEYDTSEEAVWRRGRRVSLTAKRTTWPYQTRKDAHLSDGPGSGGYNVRTKPAGPKRTFSSRHREGLHAGHPNYLVQAVDTLGFATPGPPLTRPDSIRGAKHFIAQKLADRNPETVGPGPAGYMVPTPVAPAPLIGEILFPLRPPDNPAPNQYSLPTSPREGKTFGLKTQLSVRERGPPPNTYNHRRPRAQSAAHFTHRAFAWKSEQRPSPAEYSVTANNDTPEYSCRENCLPIYPDILLYPEYQVTLKPGVGEYSPDRDFADNSNPAYSVGLPLPLKPNDNPGPNKYVVDHSHLSTLPTQPSYTMRPQVRGVARETGPGPAGYTPRPTSGKAFSMTPRRKNLKGSIGPSPNAYQLSTGVTHKGTGDRGRTTSMKGRPTPLQYNGFSNTALVRLGTLS